MKESKEEIDTVELKDVDFISLNNVLKYMYTQILDENYTIEEYIKMYDMADMYIVEGLCDDIVNQIKQNINIDNFHKILLFSEKYEIKDLYKETICFIYNNWKDIKHNDYMKSLYSEDNTLLYNLMIDLMEYKTNDNI